VHNEKEEFICTAHYVGQEFSPPDRSYEFVSSQIVSHDDFKQDTYIYVTWKRATPDETDQMSLWDEESEKE
jgi:hypothetical protein|tara:strand:+ start:957 stop:1169 length:213 start_codon:yes stop_codon:yes gene_type:complete